MAIDVYVLASWKYGKHQFSNSTEVGPWTIANVFCTAAYYTSASDLFNGYVCQQFGYLCSNALMCCITLKKELISLILKGLAKILTAASPHKC